MSTLPPIDDGQSFGRGLERDVMELTEILTAYNSKIAVMGRLHLLSSHIHAETVYMRLLNTLYGWSLINKNEAGASEEAVDLVDEKNRIVLQVTSTCSSSKINNTLESDAIKQYKDKGFTLKFAFVGNQHDAVKVQGVGAKAWTIRNPHKISFNRHDDTLFTADIVSSFEHIDTAEKREEVLGLVYGDIGRLVYNTVNRFAESGITKQNISKSSDGVTSKCGSSQLYVSGQCTDGRRRQFEVYISYRSLDEDGKPTRDSELASSLFEALSRMGISAFFSLLSLKELGQSEYESAIDAALDQARVVVVVGTSLDNICSRWVKYEWESFHNDIVNGRNPSGILLSYVEAVNPNSLPGQLRGYECLNAYDVTPWEVAQFVEQCINAETEPVRSHRLIDPERSIINDKDNEDIHLIMCLGYPILYNSDQGSFGWVDPIVVTGEDDVDRRPIGNPVTITLYRTLSRWYFSRFSEKKTDTSCHSIVKEIHSFGHWDGVHFTLSSSPNIRELGFLIKEHYDVKSSMSYLELEQMESIEFDDGMSQTFFLSENDINGSKIIILTIDNEKRLLYINNGVLNNDAVRLSKKPWLLDLRSVFSIASSTYDSFNTSDASAVLRIMIDDHDSDGFVRYDEQTVGAAPMFINLEDGQIIQKSVTFDDEDGTYHVQADFPYCKPHLAIQLRRKIDIELGDKVFMPMSDYHIGMCYLHGVDNFPKSLLAAAEYFERDGSAESCYAIANIFRNEEELQDDAIALDYLVKAAQSGCYDAQIEVSLIAILDSSAFQNLFCSVDAWLSEAILNGHNSARLIKAYMYEFGVYYSKSVDKAYEMYQLCVRDYEPCKIRLEKWCYNPEGDSAAEDNGIAEYCIGGPLLYGTYEFSKNAYLAVRFLEIAAKKGCFDAQYELFMFYSDSDNDCCDVQRATELCLVCIAQDTPVTIRLTDWLIDGNSTLPINEAIGFAVRALERLASRGDATAMNNLGWILSGKTDFPPDYSYARVLFEKATELNDVNAPYNLARMYESGLGVGQDTNYAIELYRIAAHRGSKNAKKHLKDLGVLVSTSR